MKSWAVRHTPRTRPDGVGERGDPGQPARARPVLAAGPACTSESCGRPVVEHPAQMLLELRVLPAGRRCRWASVPGSRPVGQVRSARPCASLIPRSRSRSSKISHGAGGLGQRRPRPAGRPRVGFRAAPAGRRPASRSPVAVRGGLRWASSQTGTVRPSRWRRVRSPLQRGPATAAGRPRRRPAGPRRGGPATSAGVVAPAGAGRPRSTRSARRRSSMTARAVDGIVERIVRPHRRHSIAHTHSEQVRHLSSSLVRGRPPRTGEPRCRRTGRGGRGANPAEATAVRQKGAFRTLDGPVWHVVRICLFTISCEYFWALMRESRHDGHSQIGPARLRGRTGRRSAARRTRRP